MESDNTDYITNNSISSERLNIAPSNIWYYSDNGSVQKFRKLINSLKTCGDNDVCNDLYKF